MSFAPGLRLLPDTLAPSRWNASFRSMDPLRFRSPARCRGAQEDFSGLHGAPFLQHVGTGRSSTTQLRSHRGDQSAFAASNPRPGSYRALERPHLAHVTLRDCREEPRSVPGLSPSRIRTETRRRSCRAYFLIDIEVLLCVPEPAVGLDPFVQTAAQILSGPCWFGNRPFRSGSPG